MMISYECVQEAKLWEMQSFIPAFCQDKHDIRGKNVWGVNSAAEILSQFPRNVASWKTAPSGFSTWMKIPDIAFFGFWISFQRKECATIFLTKWCNNRNYVWEWKKGTLAHGQRRKSSQGWRSVDHPQQEFLSPHFLSLSLSFVPKVLNGVRSLTSE